MDPMDAPDWPDFDLFFWLVLSGVLAHLGVALWLCKVCWHSSGRHQTKTPVYPSGNRIAAGITWAKGEDYQLHFSPRRSSRETQVGKGLASLIRRR